MGSEPFENTSQFKNEGIVDTVHAIDISEIARDASTHADYVSEKNRSTRNRLSDNCNSFKTTCCSSKRVDGKRISCAS